MNKYSPQMSADADGDYYFADDFDAEIASRDARICELEKALHEIYDACCVPLNARDERDAVHFCYNKALELL
jgi:hypothetical protein